MAEPLTAPRRVPTAKIAVPELPAEFSSRPALLQVLDAADDTQVIVLSAPAGSGKTLLLADWVRREGGPRTAWISLDADDNDPVRLWSAVLDGVTRVSSPSVRIPPQRAAAAPSSSPGRDLVDQVADALDDLDDPVRVVLDDVQQLTGREVLRDLVRLIRRSPASLRLVLASRTDPPVSIPRLRLEGRVHEIRADLLRFTPADAATMLGAGGLELTAAQVSVLHSRTDGWAAGLRLAALALHRTEDVPAFVTRFSGDERSVAEYLTVEILDAMSPDVREFLRVVSVCSPVPAAVAVELSGRADAEHLLDVICHETPLVERTSSNDYRIQPLLRSYLVADLARQRPEVYQRLHAAAAQWWLAAGDPVHALRHAERTGDPHVIAALVHESGVALFLAGDLGSLRRALAAVGADLRATDPWLALTAAITHLDARALPSAAVELENARRAWPADPPGDLEVLRASAELLAMSLGVAVEPLADGQGPGSTTPAIEALLHASVGTAEFGNPDGVDGDLARSELHQALDLARLHDFPYLEVQCLYTLATVAAVHGDLPEMNALAEQALTTARRRGRHPSGWSAGPAGLVALADLLAGRPAEAAAVADEALGTWDLLPPEAAYILHAVHGAALADQGRRSAGLAEMRAARTEFGNSSAALPTVAALAVLEHRVALVSGNGSAAAEVTAWFGPRAGTSGETLMLRAWGETAAGRHEAARGIAARVHEPDMRVLLPYTVVEAFLVEAEAALQADEHASGRSALEAAIRHAEPLEVARPFALCGPLTRQLLEGRLDGGGRSRFAVQLAAAMSAVDSDVAVPLSEREMAVLTLLPSLLSAREIATEFTVSVNTVKSHIRSIYAKLGVSTRREAVLRAQERGLVP
jgi:LuxR family maltose regulon positive regulatory protein